MSSVKISFFVGLVTLLIGMPGLGRGQEREADLSGGETSSELAIAKSNILTSENSVLRIVEERNIAAQTSGLIHQTHIREGSLVTADQLMMEIDESQPRIELKKAEKELEMARLEAASRVDLIYVERSIEVAQAELSRAMRSNQRRPGVVPQSELDQLALVVNRSLAEKEKAEFQIEMRGLTSEIQQIKLELDKLKQTHCQIKSPMAGMIVEILRRKGEWVETSEAVARVIRLDVLRTELKVPADEALNDLIGATAIFHPKLQAAGVRPSYPGKVVFINPEANAISSEVRVWVEIENVDLKLIPGLTGRVEIERTITDQTSK